MRGKKQSIVDLVVLGILLKEPMNAYKLTAYVDQNHLVRMLKVSAPAIYKSCKRMLASGYLRGKSQKHSGSPEMMMYTVSASGKRQFNTLLSHFSNQQVGYYLDINSVVYCLEGMSEKEGLELIDSISIEINAMQQWLSTHIKQAEDSGSFGARMIVSQYLMVAETLVEWSSLLRSEFIKSHKGEK